MITVSLIDARRHHQIWGDRYEIASSEIFSTQGTIVDRIRSGDEVPVFVDRVVSPTYTPDIARTTRALLTGDVPPGLYHCVNSGHATWQQIAARAAELLGLPFHPRPMTLETAGLRARRPRYCALSNAKLAAVGCDMPTWEAALAAFLATD